MSFSDKELMVNAKKGDIKAFEKLIEKYERNIYNLALKATGDRDMASELAQVIFLKAYQSINSLDNAGSFSLWIYKLAYYYCFSGKKEECNFLHGRKANPEAKYSNVC